MKRLVVLVGVLCSLSAFSRTLDDYTFPISNKYLATLSNVIAKPTDYKYKTAELEFMPERSNIEFVKNRHRLDITFKLQKHRAPLVFILAGLGGSSETGSTLILSKLFYEMGYHAVTLPNPVSWGFSLGGSRTGLTGYAPEDVRDLYRFMKFTDEYLKTRHDLKVSNYAVMGYSMGGLYTAFTAQLDKDEKYFNFKRSLMINPPVDLLYGINVLDGMYDEGMKMSEVRRNWAFGYVINEGVKIYDEYQKGVLVENLVQKFTLSDSELQWVIGSNFRSSLRDLILVSQSIHDLGVLKTPWTWFSRDARTREAEQYSFLGYLEKIYFPFIGSLKENDVDSFVYSGSLLALMENFKNDSTAYIMHNMDDFLLRPDDGELLENTFGDRCTLFPLGGHVGNLWWDINQEEIRKVMAGLQ